MSISCISQITWIRFIGCLCYRWRRWQPSYTFTKVRRWPPFISHPRRCWWPLPTFAHKGCPSSYSETCVRWSGKSCLKHLITPALWFSLTSSFSGSPNDIYTQQKIHWQLSPMFFIKRYLHVFLLLLFFLFLYFGGWLHAKLFKGMGFRGFSPGSSTSLEMKFVRPLMPSLVLLVPQSALEWQQKMGLQGVNPALIACPIDHPCYT